MMHRSAAASLVAAFVVLESAAAFAGQPIGPVPMVAEINARTDHQHAVSSEARRAS